MAQMLPAYRFPGNALLKVDGLSRAIRHDGDVARSIDQQNYLRGEAADNKSYSRGLDAQKMALAQNNALTPKPTAGMREYEYAKQQGFNGSFMDFQLARRKAGATTVNVGAGETAYDKEMGKKLAQTQIELQQQGYKAQQNLSDLNTMEQAIEDPNLYTGAGGEMVQGAKRLAQFFNVPVEGVASGEVVGRVSKKIALNLKDNLPGPLSDSDRKFLVNLPPGITTSREGNRRLIEIGVAQQKWQIERAQLANKIIAQNGGRLTPEAFAQIQQLDGKWASQIGGMVSVLRNQPQAEQRRPSVGFGDLRQRFQGLEE